MKLPATWTQTELRNIVTYQKGKKPAILKEEEFTGSVPYLDIKALEKNEIRQYADEKSSNILNEEAVAIVWDGARSGWVSKGKKGALGSTLAALKPIQADVNYLFYFLKSQFQYLNTNLRGIGIPHIDPEKIWPILVPLPPFKEQQLISQKLDEIFYNVKALHVGLGRILELIKVFKEKVLTQAFSGKLTEEWRKINKGDSSKEEIAIIKKDRIKRYEEQLAEFKLGNCRKPRKIEYEENTEQPLYDSWTRIFIEEIFDVETGGTPSRSNNQYWDNATIPWVKSGEVNNSFITKTGELISVLAEKETNAKLFPTNSILIAMYGEGKTRGQVGVLKIRAATNQAIAAMVNSDLPESTIKFVFYFGLSQYEAIRKEAVGGNQPNLNLAKIKKWSLDFPPLKEQAEIVNRIEELFKIVDIIENRFTILKQLTSALPTTTLSKAFKGELLKEMKDRIRKQNSIEDRDKYLSKNEN